MSTITPLHALVVAAESIHVTAAAGEYVGMLHLPEVVVPAIGWLAVLSFCHLAGRAVPSVCATCAQVSRTGGEGIAVAFETIGKVPSHIGDTLIRVRHLCGAVLRRVAEYLMS